MLESERATQRQVDCGWVMARLESNHSVTMAVEAFQGVIQHFYQHFYQSPAPFYLPL